MALAIKATRTVPSCDPRGSVSHLHRSKPTHEGMRGNLTECDYGLGITSRSPSWLGYCASAAGGVPTAPGTAAQSRPSRNDTPVTGPFRAFSLQTGSKRQAPLEIPRKGRPRPPGGQTAGWENLSEANPEPSRPPHVSGASGEETDAAGGGRSAGAPEAGELGARARSDAGEAARQDAGASAQRPRSRVRVRLLGLCRPPARGRESRRPRGVPGGGQTGGGGAGRGPRRWRPGARAAARGARRPRGFSERRGWGR